MSDVVADRTRFQVAAPARVGTWVAVCHLDDLVPDRGACVLVNGRQVALFRVTPDDRVHALSNYDPFSSAFVLSRGIVGSRNGVAKVASPMYKQSFDLETGVCLDDPTVSVDVYDVRCGADGRIEVRAP
jgi:nitrite reductase (NADH) small subunit